MNSTHPLSAPLGAASPAAPALSRAVARWLIACCALVFAIVVVGGVTRLTHSGLSIVEWKPIVGALPPLNDMQWQEAFGKYKLTPEYRLVNRGMTLEGFKGIFWWEYIHRLLGRLIGVAFLLPLLWFWLRKRIDRLLGMKLAGIFILGGLQGALGWYMVQSGLVDNPRVSPFRLTAHLSLALAIYAAMFWTALGLLPDAETENDGPSGASRTLQWLGWTVTGIVVYMIITGGFVAGIRAGLAYNTFPLMNGHVVPPGMLSVEPWYLNFFYNMATVQFDHRLGAWALAFLVPWLWSRARKDDVSPAASRAADFLLAAVALQIVLGISALLMRVPVALGALHQGGAVIVLTAALYLNYSLRSRPQKER